MSELLSLSKRLEAQLRCLQDRYTFLLELTLECEEKIERGKLYSRGQGLQTASPDMAKAEVVSQERMGIRAEARLKIIEIWKTDLIENIKYIQNRVKDAKSLESKLTKS